MERIIFLGSIILCIIFLGLSQLSDPEIFGIDEEPERIMFYGGSGLLAGLCGLVAIGSSIYLGAIRFAGLSGNTKRYFLTVMLIIFTAVLAVLGIRFFPR